MTTPPEPAPGPEPQPAELPNELPSDTAWQRLDRRMLLIHPIQEVTKFFPLIILAMLFGPNRGGTPYELIGVIIPVGIGLAEYFTTRYRITEGRIELHRGLLSRRLLSARVERIRTVDLTASPIHRILGLTTIQIGTGDSSEGPSVELDALAKAQAERLRNLLLADPSRMAHAQSVGQAAGSGPLDLSKPSALEPITILRFRPQWLRFAPFTSTGIAMLAATIGVLAQVASSLDLESPSESLESTPVNLWLVVIVVIGVMLVASVPFSVLGYLVANYGFQLTRDPLVFRLRRGLTTTKETTLEAARLYGLFVRTPLPLRLAGGASVQAIVTGLGDEQASSATLAPPVPRADAWLAATAVLGPSAPAPEQLRGHGPAARLRRWTRAGLTAVCVAAVGSAPILYFDLPVALFSVIVLAVACCAVLGWDRARCLGSLVSNGWFTARDGSLRQRQSFFHSRGIVGWNLSASYFQRRAGVLSLSPTMAGGPQKLTAIDVPEERAVAMMAELSGPWLAPFLIKQEVKDQPED